jgi:hypothetical protein
MTMRALVLAVLALPMTLAAAQEAPTPAKPAAKPAPQPAAAQPGAAQNKTDQLLDPPGFTYDP